MSEIKLCMDCKWIRPDEHYRTKKYWLFGPVQETKSSMQFARCAHPELGNRATGGGGEYCEIERCGHLGLCGRAGKLWEPKA